jgi:hypothetical protein
MLILSFFKFFEHSRLARCPSHSEHPSASSVIRSCLPPHFNDLFGTPQGSPRTDKLIAASIQWAKKIHGEY